MVRIIYQVHQWNNFTFGIFPLPKSDFPNLEQVHRINYPYANCFYVIGD